MNPRLQSFLSLLRLGRLELALSAVSNIWLMVFLARAVEPTGRRSEAIQELPLWALLLLTATVAIGLHVYGAALNDVLDRRHDRLFRPNRPIPAGRIRPGTAASIGVASLLLGMFASVFLGQESMLLCLLAAVGILFYDALGKFIPAVGLVTLGLMRAVNMFLPNPTMGFAWPIGLAMTHVIGCLAITYWLDGKRPRMELKDWAVLFGAWAFWLLVLLSWMNYRGTMSLHHDQGLWLAPVLSVMVFMVVTYRMISSVLASIGSRRALGGSFLRMAMLWLMIYDAAWALAAELYWQSLVHLGLLAVALGVARLLNEWGEAFEGDEGYRIATAPPMNPQQP